jgi:hypothetical protein
MRGGEILTKRERGARFGLRSFIWNDLFVLPLTKRVEANASLYF